MVAPVSGRGSEPASDGGVPALARALRDAGMEVIYTGPGHTPEQIVRTALQEDADVIGLAVGSAGGPGGDVLGDSAPAALVAELVELLARGDAADVVVFAAPVAESAGPGGSGPETGASAGAAGPGPEPGEPATPGERATPGEPAVPGGRAAPGESAIFAPGTSPARIVAWIRARSGSP